MRASRRHRLIATPLAIEIATQEYYCNGSFCIHNYLLQDVIGGVTSQKKVKKNYLVQAKKHEVVEGGSDRSLYGESRWRGNLRMSGQPLRFYAMN